MAEFQQLMSTFNSASAPPSLRPDMEHLSDELLNDNISQHGENNRDHSEQDHESDWETDSASNLELDRFEAHARRISHEDEAYLTPVEDGAESVEGDCEEDGGRGSEDLYGASSGVGHGEQERYETHSVGADVGEACSNRTVNLNGDASRGVMLKGKAVVSCNCDCCVDAATSADGGEDSGVHKEEDSDRTRQHSARALDTARKTKTPKLGFVPTKVTTPPMNVASHTTRSSSFRRHKPVRYASSLDASNSSDGFDHWEGRRRKSFDSLYSETDTSEDGKVEVHPNLGHLHGGRKSEGGHDRESLQPLESNSGSKCGRAERSKTFIPPCLRSATRSTTSMGLEAIASKKSVTFQLDDSSDSDGNESVRIYSPPPRMRLFPLRGGILKFQPSSAIQVPGLGEEQVGDHESSPSLASSLENRDSPLRRLATLSHVSLADQMGLEDATTLDLTIKGGTVDGDYAIGPKDRLDEDLRSTSRFHFTGGEVRLREVKVQFGQIRQVEKRMNTVGVQPSLRSTKDRGGRHGPKLNLREAFRQIALANKEEAEEEKKCVAENAMLQFEKTAAALKIRREVEKAEAIIQFNNNQKGGGFQEALRKDSQQSYTSPANSISTEGSLGRDDGDPALQSLEKTHSSQSSHTSDLSHATASLKRRQYPPGRFGVAVTTDGKRSEPLYSSTFAKYGSASSVPVQPAARNFSRPLAETPRLTWSLASTEHLTEQRPGTPSPHLITYAESSRLQQSRHTAWAVRERVLHARMEQEIYVARHRARLGVEGISRPDLETMRKYWRSQENLLHGFDATHHRVPLRRPGPPSPCSSCTTFTSYRPLTPARSRTPAIRRTPKVRRAIKKYFWVLRNLPSPRWWFKYRTRHHLVKYPRRMRRSISRTEDWPSKNEEEIERTLHRRTQAGPEDCEAREVPIAAECSSVRYYATSAQRTGPEKPPQVSWRTIK